MFFRYEVLFPMIGKFLASNKSPRLLASVQSILKTMSPFASTENMANQCDNDNSIIGGFSREMVTPVGASQTQILSELGFAGLLEAGSFQNVTKLRKQENAALVCRVIDDIVGL